MRVFITVLVLIFSLQSWTKADDIRDFEIEGMSIGDSLLDYFSENEIKNNTRHNYYKNKINFQFVAIEFYKHSLFKNYSGVQFHVKKNDKKYKIYSISGYDFYDNDIKGCYKKQNEIDKELSVLFKDAEREEGKHKLRSDKSGKSTIRRIFYTFESGDATAINCYDWSNKMLEENNWTDNLDVSIETKELIEAFIIKNPH